MTDADHIKVFRLFDLARTKSAGKDFHLAAWEKEHLEQCAECRGVVEIFDKQFKRKPPLVAGLPIRRFTIGDHIEVIAPGDYTRKRGVVTQVLQPQTGDFVYRYRVHFLDGGTGMFFGFELESAA
jgi:hypothetical protein